MPRAATHQFTKEATARGGKYAAAVQSVVEPTGTIAVTSRRAARAEIIVVGLARVDIRNINVAAATIRPI